MKKTFIFISLVMSSVLGANAQVQTATLQQGDSVQVFYGIDGLKNAVDASQDGNTIYLSAGYFNGVSYLSKSIKIIGAGGFSTNETKSTGIGGDITVARNSGDYTNYLELEGFQLNQFRFTNPAKMVKLSKISINGGLFFDGANDVSYENIEISRCIIKTTLRFASNNSHFNVLISNSIIDQIDCYPPINSTSTLLLSNSIIYKSLNQPFANTSLQNNIFVETNNSSNQSPNSVYNNIFMGTANFLYTNDKSGNWENVVLSDLFVNQPENKWDPTYDYHLKNPQNYIGTDGTQVGIYGGLFPWNPIPSNPQILESKVNPTTTNDGKLNFQIKAEAQQ